MRRRFSGGASADFEVAADVNELVAVSVNGMCDTTATTGSSLKIGGDGGDAEHNDTAGNNCFCTSSSEEEKNLGSVVGAVVRTTLKYDRETLVHFSQSPLCRVPPTDFHLVHLNAPDIIAVIRNSSTCLLPSAMAAEQNNNCSSDQQCDQEE